MQVKPDRQDGRNHGGYVEKTNVNSIMNGVYFKVSVCGEHGMWEGDLFF